MTKTRHAQSRVDYMDTLDLTLAQLGATAAPMPVTPQKISFRTRLNSTFLLMGALIIVALYICVPLVAAIHYMLFPVIQDITITVAIVVEVGFFMMYIIMKTDGR